MIKNAKILQSISEIYYFIFLIPNNEVSDENVHIAHRDF